MQKEQPTHAMVAFDAGSTTFRHAFFDDYKGGRDSMPGELAEQMPYLKEMLDAFGMSDFKAEVMPAFAGTMPLIWRRQWFDGVHWKRRLT